MKALDLSRGVAGAYCGSLLALAGVDVVRARPPDLADPVLAAWVARGVTVLDLDPGTAAGRAALLDLLPECDALIEDWGAGGLEAAGLTAGDPRARNPDLIVARMSDFGQTGPLAGWSGTDLTALAAGGLLFLTGSWDTPPMQLAPYQASLTLGLLGAVATLAALWQGGPVTVDLSKQEAVLSLITPALTEYVYSGAIPARDGPVAAMARIERSADGWVYAGPGAAATADYQRYAEFLGLPELAEERFATPDGRMANWQEHQALLQPRLAQRTTAEWLEDAARWRLTFGPVQTTTELLNCPVLAERAFFGPLPVRDGDAAVAPRAPFLVDGERPAFPSAFTPGTSESDHGPARTE
jgi:crotonobetainyl-CoA:carnitine CoA-transferase CaiB-like acyl-CoA transferase